MFVNKLQSIANVAESITGITLNQNCNIIVYYVSKSINIILHKPRGTHVLFTYISVFELFSS